MKPYNVFLLNYIASYFTKPIHYVICIISLIFRYILIECVPPFINRIVGPRGIVRGGRMPLPNQRR